MSQDVDTHVDTDVDTVRTGRFYTKGGPVTKQNFTAYKAHRQQLGAQGVGPTQLTLPAFQDEADERGGCWDWRVNARVGFEILSKHIALHGLHDGFRRYNGSGPAAEKYADDAITKVGAWRKRLDRVLAPATRTARPVLHEGDAGSMVSTVQTFMNTMFPHYSTLDLGPRRYGAETSAVIADFQRRAGVAGAGVDPAGRSIGSRTWGALEFFDLR